VGKAKVIAGAVAFIAVALAVGSLWRMRAELLEIQKGSAHINTIDFYGLRTISGQQVRARLNLKVGDAAPITVGAGPGKTLKVAFLRLFGQAETSSIVKRLEQIPGVVRAEVGTVINGDANRSVAVFVGIEEKNMPQFGYRPVPRGSIALPKDMIDTYDQHGEALFAALTKGGPDLDMDDSQGHALSSDSAMRALEEKMIGFAASDLAILREVLKNSAEAHQRMAAAWIIAYAPDKRAILGDLTDAVSDSNETVRNNAARALGVIAEFAATKPELGIHIDPSRFIDMLQSLTWTDRNKATMVLDSLTAAHDAETLRRLRERALPALIEMSRWKDVHASDSFTLLGRVAGLSEEEIQRAWDRGERERVIAMVADPAPVR
jgi:hypothetical protein